MLLKMKDLTNEIKYQCKFEKVVEDLVMITIESEIDIVRIMSYWRLTGVEDTPPLEIGINCDNTQISRIVFFVDLYTLKTGKHINETETIKGNVQVDVSIFSKLYEFIDIDKSHFEKRKAIEVGHIFQNEQVYSKMMNGTFTNKEGKKDYYYNLSGVKQIKIHEFRHSHACLLFTNKIELEGCFLNLSGIL